MSMTTPQQELGRQRLRPWEKNLTDNERAWIEFIRLISNDTDPAPTLLGVQKLRWVLVDRPLGI